MIFRPATRKRPLLGPFTPPSSPQVPKGLSLRALPKPPARPIQMGRSAAPGLVPLAPRGLFIAPVRRAPQRGSVSFGTPAAIFDTVIVPAVFESALASTISALPMVVSLAQGNCYPVQIPETRLPPVVLYQVISKIPEMHLDGPNGVIAARTQISCRSHTYGDDKALAQALRTKFAGFQGNMAGISVLAVIPNDSSDHYEEPLEGSDTGTFHEPVDFTFRYLG